MTAEPNYDSYFDPPDDNWGRCPYCGCSQEDCSGLGDELWKCPECGNFFTDDAAHPDPRQEREDAELDRAGL